MEQKEKKEMAVTVLDNISEGVLVLSRDFKIIWANKKIMDSTHLKEKDIVGDFCYKVTHHREEPCQPPHDVCPIHEILKTGKSVAVFHTHFDREGNEFYAEVSAYPMKDEKGEIAQFVHIARDVTERIKAERLAQKEKEIAAAAAAAAAKTSAEEWQRTFDSIADLIFMQNADHTILRVNKAFADALKAKPEDIVGKKCHELLHKSDKPWPDCPFERTKKDKAAHIQEVDDANIGIPFLITTSPILDEKGELVGSVHVAKDITYLKDKEKELAKKMHDLETFHKVAVGRELKMEELKKRIKELEAKLGGHE